MAEADILLRVIALIVGTASIAWLAVALPMRIAPRASLRFALANLTLLASLVLTLQRRHEANIWFWQVADFLGAITYLITRSGLRVLFKLPLQNLAHFLFAAVYAVVLMVIPFDNDAIRYFGICYSLFAALLMTLTCVDVFLPAKREFNLLASVTVALPFACTALIMAWRLSEIMTTPSPQHSGIESSGLLWSFSALALVLNMSMFGCVLTRMVTKIRHYSERDYLTGLFNRRAFSQRLHLENERSTRTQSQYSVLLFDLDHFKQINDQYGHACGDVALKHTAALAKKTLRKLDILARYGGEEFIVLLPETDHEQAHIAAERLRVQLERTPFTFSGHTITVTASFGGVSHHQGDIDALLKHADQALYDAKRAGRNGVVMYPNHPSSGALAS